MTTNGYWPQWDGGWKYRLLAFLLNLTARLIGFKETNANKHDNSYSIGWTERDRIRADLGFLRRLLYDCEGNKLKAIVAHLFYFAVRLLWKPSFNYKEWTK